MRYADMFGGSYAENEQVTIDSFRRAAESTAILHFHGHARKSRSGNILDQELQLHEVGS